MRCYVCHSAHRAWRLFDIRLQLYVDTSKSPFIYIYAKDGLTIANAQTKAKMQVLFKNLLIEMKC